MNPLIPGRLQGEKEEEALEETPFDKEELEELMKKSASYGVGLFLSIPTPKEGEKNKPAVFLLNTCEDAPDQTDALHIILVYLLQIIEQMNAASNDGAVN